jgi:hypothetical protein
MFGQVERALTLFATGTATLAMYNRGTKNAVLPKTMTTKSGKSSEKSTAFNEIVWGGTTRARISQARTALRDSSLEKILQKAQELERKNTSGSKTPNTTETQDVNESLAKIQVQDLSDLEWD